MSSRRSRFKVAASIPVRRKLGLTAETQSADTIIESDIEKKSCPVPIANEEEIVLSEQPERDVENTDPKSVDIPTVSVSNIEEKSFFKKIKPSVQLPIKKQRNRPNTSESHDEKKSIGKESEAIVTESKSCRLEPTVADQSENTLDVLKSEDSRPTTPPLTAAVHSSPAKSPARARFIRPALLDSAIRRHSIHASSASESEDDSRRNYASPRMRKISENAAVIKTTPLPPSQVFQTPSGDTDASECVRLALLPKRKRPKISNFVRKIAEARRDFNKRFAREKPDRSNLKMFDLIFYNPQSTSVGLQAAKLKPKVDKKPTTQVPEPDEDDPDDPEKAEGVPTEGGSEEEPEVAMPVPQVKIGANGEIILDERSLVIETTEARKGREALLNSVPVFEERNRRVSYYRKKHNKFKDWSPIETKCFYKALNSIGTDFALMQSLFPDRTRGELKNKFKREERVNSSLIDNALSRPSEFNIILLKEEIDHERTLVEEETKRKLDEKIRLDREKKEGEAMRKAERAEREEIWGSGVAALRRFVGHQIPTEVDKLERRSQRGPQRRKLCEDYIDPFEVEDEGAKLATKPGVVNQNINVQTSSKHRNLALIENNDGGVALDFSNYNRSDKATQVEALKRLSDIHSSQNIIRGKKILKQVHKKKKEKKEVVNVYYPVEQDDSDCESVMSSVNCQERTEEIGDYEFVELLQRNILNLEQSTIRFQAPSPSCGENDNTVRVILDVVQSSSIKKPLNGSLVRTEGSKTYKVQSNIKAFNNKPSDMARADTFIHGRTTEIFNEVSTSQSEPKISYENPGNVQTCPFSQSAAMPMETETVYTFSPRRNYSAKTSESTQDDGEIEETNCVAENFEAGPKISYEKPKNDQIYPGCQSPTMPMETETVYTFSPPSRGNYSVKTTEPVSNDRVVEDATNCLDVDFEETHDLAGAKTSDINFLVEPTNDKSIEVDSRVNEDDTVQCDGLSLAGTDSHHQMQAGSEVPITEARVNYRMTGGFQYALIEAGTNPEQKRTYLAGLRPGSFVFMANESPHMPLERRCSMFMIAEKISADGVKEFTPMPVVLPPDLMKLITEELNCR